MRVRTYCFPGCFTRPPGTSTRNHPCGTTTSKPVVPRGSCPMQSDPAGRCGPYGGGGRLTKTTRSRATWGALRHVVSVRSLRGFRAAGLATPGPRSLRLGSASRGNLGGRPTAVKRPRATKPHPPQNSRRERSCRACARPLRHPSPPMPTTERLRAALLAPVRPRTVRAPQRGPRGRALPQRRRALHAAPRATSCSTPSRPTGSSAGSACGAPRSARTPTSAWASSGWPCPRSCRRCCPRSRSAGAWPVRRGGAASRPRARERLCAMPSSELDLEAVISIIDPDNVRSIRVAEKLGMRRGAAHVHPRTRRRLLAYEISSQDAGFSPGPP